MSNIIIETTAQVIACLLVTLIGVLGTWLTVKIGQKKELTNISIATNEVINAAQLTVIELQQTVVDSWKAASADGKLSEDEVQELGTLLIQKTMEKMSASAKDLLVAAGVDISALIVGAGEAMIQSMKKE